VGNARTALYNWLLARRLRGAFILRIEDTDVQRNEPGAEEGILEDLRWLGFDWDEGPDRGGPHGPYRQSDRAASYREAGALLIASGHAYRCFCSMEEIEAERKAQREAGLPPRYSGRCRAVREDEAAGRAGRGEPFVLRLRVPAGGVSLHDLVRRRVDFPADQIGDPILIRSDGRAAYNFAVVVDDIGMRITHVVRGDDHLSNTPRQILIYRALGHEPPAFAHLSMILGPDGARLHKRHGAVSVVQFREAGVAPEGLVNHLALLGWSHPDGREILAADEIVSAFSLDRVPGSAATFDPAKLAFLNAHHIRKMAPERLFTLSRRFLIPSFPAAAGAGEAAAAWWGRALSAVSGQMETLADAPKALALFFDPRGEDGDETAGGGNTEGGVASASERHVLASFEVEASRRDLAAPGVFRECAAAVAAATGVKGRDLFHPLRLAFTGRERGPELDRLVPLIEEGSRLLPGLGVEACIDRARSRIQRLAEGDPSRSPAGRGRP